MQNIQELFKKSGTKKFQIIQILLPRFTLPKSFSFESDRNHHLISFLLAPPFNAGFFIYMEVALHKGYRFLILLSHNHKRNQPAIYRLILETNLPLPVTLTEMPNKEWRP